MNLHDSHYGGCRLRRRSFVSLLRNLTLTDLRVDAGLCREIAHHSNQADIAQHERDQPCETRHANGQVTASTEDHDR